MPYGAHDRLTPEQHEAIEDALTARSQDKDATGPRFLDGEVCFGPRGRYKASEFLTKSNQIVYHVFDAETPDEFGMATLVRVLPNSLQLSAFIEELLREAAADEIEAAEYLEDR